MSRFLIYGPHYAPEPIGNAPYTTAYAEALAAAGHDVTVVTTYPHYPDWSAAARRFRYTVERQNGVRLVRVPHAVPRNPNALGRLRLEMSYGAAAMAATPFLGRFDAVIGVMPLLSSAAATLTTGRLRSMPCGLLVQDLMGAAAAQGGVPGAGRAIGRAVAAVERLTLRVDDVAVVALGFVSTAEGAGARKVHYLPNFTILASAARSREETRARLGLADDDFVVTYSGNLGYKQDFDTVLAAAALLRDESRLRFLIVGEGSQRETIAVTATSERLNLVLQPLQPVDEVPNVLAASDVLLAPQRATDTDMSLPSKLTAYMSAGRAVLAVASACSETARIVTDSGGGVVVPAGEPESLAEALRKLVADPEALEVMGAAGATYAQAMFDRAGALERFVGFAEELART